MNSKKNEFFVASHINAVVISNKVIATVPFFFVIMWSSGAVFVELGLQFTKPLTFLSFRLILAMVIMWGVCLFLRPSLPVKLSEWRDILITGIFLQAGYQIFFFLALANDVSPGVLSIILGTQPILTAIFSKGRASFIQWFGLLLGLLGLILVVGNSIFEGKSSNFGMISAVLSLFCITLGTFLQKQTSISQPVNMAIQYTGSSLLLICLTLIFEQFKVNWTMVFGISLLWMVLIVSVGATLLLYFMIRRGFLTNVTGLFYSVPPVTALLDYAVFGHVLNFTVIIGMLFVVLALFLINRRGRLV